MEFSRILDAQLDLFKRQMVKVADRFGSGTLSPEQFREGFQEFKGTMNGLGAALFASLVAEADSAASEVVWNGRIYRHKHDSSKEWLTHWGKITVPRALYQQDRGGEAYVPLDDRCGMVDRFMTPDIEEVCVLLASRLVPEEVEDALGRIYPDGPSRKAIQNALSRAGAYLEAHRPDLEEVLNKTARLDGHGGDILVAGWDGTTVPLRESAPHRGRPAERPGVRSGDRSPTAWKEAGVGMVAVYETPLDPLTEDAQKLDARYFARMPEHKMAQVVSQVTDQTEAALEKRSFEHKVFIADGKREIWATVEDSHVFSGFTGIVDFWHVAQHVSSAAEAVHGKKSGFANAFFKRWCHKLKHEPGAVDGLIRSLTRYRDARRKGSAPYKILQREIGYLKANRVRMDYATYRAKGLPIGSGPIEAACKTLVGHRLKRSGMRWSKEHGQEVLNLRAPLLSGRWDVMWNWYLTHSTKMANAA